MMSIDPQLQSPPPLLAARGLAFDRDGERIFGPLDFSVDAGGTLVIEGGNGSGKTTLIRVLAGLLEPGDGELAWQGVALDGRRPPAGSISLLGHALGLKPELSPVENLRWRCALDGQRVGISIPAALRSVGLDGYEDLPVRTLSAGQRKRTALAGMLLSAAPLWLMDEPYANLDRDGQRLVDRMLETHAVRGGAAIVTSHGLIGPSVQRLARVDLGALA
jgi:heme exporter protein A